MTHYISQLILLSTGMPGEEKRMRMEEAKAEKERVKAEVAELKAKRAEAKAEKERMKAEVAKLKVKRAQVKDKMKEIKLRQREVRDREKETSQLYGQEYVDFLAREVLSKELDEAMDKIQEIDKQIETLMPKPVISEEERARKNRMTWLRNHIKERGKGEPESTD